MPLEELSLAQLRGKIASGEVKTEPLVSEHFAFEDYLDAYKSIEEKGEQSMKVMIDF